MATASALLFESALEASDRPNIVLILTDDQHWNGTSVQMDPNIEGSKSDFHQTPNLETLAAAGMRFSNGYAASPLCSPTRASIETGKSPAQLGITDLTTSRPGNSVWQNNYVGLPLTPPTPDSFDDRATTLPRLIKQNDASYRTALIGKWHLNQSDPSRPGAITPISSGYDHWDNREFPPDEVDPWGVQMYANLAGDYMEASVTAEQPFFLQLAQYGVHAPIRSRPEIVEKYEALPRGSIHRDPVYAAGVEDLDRSVGTVLQKIDDLGIADNTYVIYVSDNGARFIDSSAYPLRFGKATLSEGGTRVPFIISGPGIEPGSVSDVPVLTTDLFTTIHELTGGAAPLPSGVEGASLAPVLENAGDLPEGMPHLERQYHDGGAIYFHRPHNWSVSRFYRFRPTSSIRDGDYKLRIEYGEHGNDHREYLYNLAEDPSESRDLWLEMPEKTLELRTKLFDYLARVDASLPYDVKDTVALEWSGDTLPPDATFWRTTEDFHYRKRETWEFGDGVQLPRVEPIDPSQPNLPTKAIRFDGNDVLERSFFHVGDAGDRRNTTNVGTPDWDRSASIELWLRSDHLDQNQVIFESGGKSAGISLTLGDADGSALHDDLRFRILGADGQAITVDAPVNRFADPRHGFVHIAAVYDDRSDSRRAQIYVNGALAGESFGAAGEEFSLQWDEYDPAGLGNIAGELGAALGPGDLPFAGGLAGQIAWFRFQNQPLESNQVLSAYNASLFTSRHGVSSLQGEIAAPVSRPASLARGELESIGAHVIHERTGALPIDLAVDVAVASPLFLAGSDENPGGHLSPGILDAGLPTSSFTIHFDPPGEDPLAIETVAGAVEFTGAILGLISEGATLESSDGLLGTIGNYGDAAGRGLLPREGDFLLVADDLRTLHFSLSLAGDESLQFRVITEQAISGDFNFDGVVDAHDLALWHSVYNTPAGSNLDFLDWQRQFTLPTGDFNSSESVDGDDLNAWQNAYGRLPQGDGNGSGDTTGDDFLYWQRGFYEVNPDFDGNQIVNQGDLHVWQAAYGSTTGGDANGNGRTNGIDLLEWQRRTAAPSAAAVPEPATAILFLCALTLRMRVACLRTTVKA